MRQDVDITPGPITEAADAPEASGCCGGGCCGGGAAEATPGTATQQFAMEGLTCDHCVASVTEEVEAIAGVRSVRIDLVPGGRSTLRIEADPPLDPAFVAAAVGDAGYRIVG